MNEKTKRTDKINKNRGSFIRELPLRKLLAFIMALISIPMIVISFCIDRDIPTNTANLMTVLCSGSILAYIGSSSYETVKNNNNLINEKEEKEHETIE